MSALSHSGFRAYFFAAVPVVQALWAQRVTLGWLAWDVSHSAAFVGFIAALGLLPTIFAGPVFGVLVDRADIRRALMMTSGSMAAVLAVAALVAGGPGLGRWGLAAVAFTVGLITAAHHPVRMSLGPRLVPRADVPNVVALSALNFNMGRMVGPVLTGVMIAAFGAVTTLWLSAALYLPMLAAIRWMDPRPLPAAPRAGLMQGIGEGLRYLAATPVARHAMVLTAAIAVLVRGYLELLPVMAEGVHDKGAAGLGLLTAAAGAGALAAALAKTAGAGQGGIPPVTRAVLLGGIASLACLGLSSSWHAALVWTAVLGFASTFCGVGLQAAVQEDLSDHLRGRVMSLWVVVGIGAVALGSGAIGLLAGVFGLSTVLLWSGLGGTLVAAALVLPSPARRST
ncbi:MFS transporter [Jannaschia rubra]|uniref:Putative multidrug-efflux transporterc/MT1297 n=1 Tax=Jannaschia rubra TaxID=282197 RepID=A0A0M6XMX4_9RHOB|nr:MFS transporter [Jannaschia rubra]CTQ32022.1 putative multidrug-efflux transporterc/MT1297 [Jannaschia rubra]SFG39628.1 Predicted arabinose efflux permease, MFS family [Jannaschia rubra]